MDVSLYAPPGLTRIDVFVDVDLIVLEATPEAFNDDVVLGAAFAIHANPNTILLEHIDILWTRKMAALVAVDNARLTPRQRALHRLKHKADL